MILKAEQRMKAAARHLVASLFYRTGHSLAPLSGKVAILMYHRIVSEKDLQSYIQPGMYVQKEVFAVQIKFLKENFEIISFLELLDRWKQKHWDREKRYCVITFDDGWLDNYKHAYPVLKKNKIPATIFLPTGLIETDEWFWQEKLGFLLRHLYRMHIPAVRSLTARYPGLSFGNGGSAEDKIDRVIELCKALRDEDLQLLIEELVASSGLALPRERLLMNWNEVREMSQSDISFGSHSCLHKILTHLSLKDHKTEIENSLTTLQRQRVRYVPVFCYPNGDYNSETARLVQNAGYLAAVSTIPGVEECNPPNLFALKRIGIHNDISKTVPLFAYRLRSFIPVTNKSKKRRKLDERSCKNFV